MPRPKLYKTKEDKRLAMCRKSQRYYNRNSDVIKAKKKTKRAVRKDGKGLAEDVEDVECGGVLATVESVESVSCGWKGELLPTGDEQAAAELFEIRCLYRALTNDQPVLFFEQLYHDFSLWIAANPSAQLSDSPMRSVEQKLQEMQRKEQWARRKLWVATGGSSHYEDAWRISKVLSRAIVCVEDIEMTVGDSVSLEERFLQEDFFFQRASCTRERWLQM
ncbi:hypothetical protein V5O48_013641 [Marasmius crinis-equi]|uniref:Uncharacterized protein n=1 Tax=Marasmius crinis-equi TaxID=585013 RepID=A0ABR3EZI2_9AGAR